MIDIDRKNHKENSDNQYKQDFSDKELAAFFVQLMMAFEIQEYMEKSLENYNITSRLDELLFDVEKELVDLAEGVNA